MITNLNSIILSQNIRQNEIKYLLDTDYSEAFEQYLVKNTLRIYRAHKNLGNSFVLSPTYRKSIGAVNVHTVLMSSLLPSWKRYPKRDNCFIGSTNEKICFEMYKNGTGNYNSEDREVYLLFPKNNTDIAVCPKSDLWISFNKIKQDFKCESLYEFNDRFIHAIESFCKTFNIILNCEEIEKMFNFNKIESICELFSILENNIQLTTNFPQMPWLSENNKIVKCFYDEIKSNRSFIQILDMIFHPTANDFRLINTNALDKLQINREIWFDSECLFISPENFELYTRKNGDI